MLFESAKDVLEWYQKGERVITKAFIDGVAWNQVKNYPIEEKFFPVLLYMRDIETMTTRYFDELMKSATGREPIIREFMEQWATEEPVHGQLLSRFLEEAGCPQEGDWRQKVLIVLRFPTSSVANYRSGLRFRLAKILRVCT